MRSLEGIIAANEKAYQEQRKDKGKDDAGGVMPLVELPYKAPARGLYPIPPTVASDVNDPEVNRQYPASPSQVEPAALLRVAMQIALDRGVSARIALALAEEEFYGR